MPFQKPIGVKESKQTPPTFIRASFHPLQKFFLWMTFGHFSDRSYTYYKDFYNIDMIRNSEKFRKAVSKIAKFQFSPVGLPFKKHLKFMEFLITID